MCFLQIQRLKKIMAGFDKDYSATKEVDVRQEELDQAVKNYQIQDVLRQRWEGLGIRREVIAMVFDDIEFEETLGAMMRELSGIAARYDLADKIDSARDAA